MILDQDVGWVCFEDLYVAFYNFSGFGEPVFD